MSRHVVLLSRDASLAVALRTLLDQADLVTVLGSPADWSTIPGQPVDTVVVDVPSARREAVIGEVRYRFSGPLVVLLAQRDDPKALLADPSLSVMKRPFAMMEFWGVLLVAFLVLCLLGYFAPNIVLLNKVQRRQA